MISPKLWWSALLLSFSSLCVFGSLNDLNFLFSKLLPMSFLKGDFVTCILWEDDHYSYLQACPEVSFFIWQYIKQSQWKSSFAMVILLSGGGSSDVNNCNKYMHLKDWIFLIFMSLYWWMNSPWVTLIFFIFSNSSEDVSLCPATCWPSCVNNFHCIQHHPDGMILLEYSPILIGGESILSSF